MTLAKDLDWDPSKTRLFGNQHLESFLWFVFESNLDNTQSNFVNFFFSGWLNWNTRLFPSGLNFSKFELYSYLYCTKIGDATFRASVLADVWTGKAMQLNCWDYVGEFFLGGGLWWDVGERTFWGCGVDVDCVSKRVFTLFDCTFTLYD